jgi:tetratricopeptide (TPR) repeat protein
MSLLFTPRRKLIVLLCVINSIIFYAQTTDILYKEAQRRIETKDYTIALNTLEKIIKIDSTNPDFYLEKAHVYFLMEDYESSISECYKAMKYRPNSSRAYYIRGQICMITESYGGANIFFTKAIKYANNTELKKESLKSKAMANNLLGRKEEAYKDLMQAYELDQTDYVTLTHIADIAFDVGNVDESIYALQKILKYKPEQEEVYLKLGIRYIEKKNYKDAEQYLKQYVEKNSKNPEVYNHLAYIDLKTGEFQEALKYLSHSLVLQPINPRAYKNMALIYQELGQTKNACNNLFKSLQQGYIEEFGYDVLDMYIEHCEE